MDFQPFRHTKLLWVFVYLNGGNKSRTSPFINTRTGMQDTIDDSNSTGTLLPQARE